MHTSSNTNTPVDPSPDVPLDIFFTEKEIASICSLASASGSTVGSYIRSATAELAPPVAPAVCPECEFPLDAYLHESCSAVREHEEIFAE